MLLLSVGLEYGNEMRCDLFVLWAAAANIWRSADHSSAKDHFLHLSQPDIQVAESVSYSDCDTRQQVAC